METNSLKKLVELQKTNSLIVQLYHDAESAQSLQILNLCTNISKLDKYKELIFLQANVNNSQDLVKKLGIEETPTILISHGSNVTQKIVGADPRKFISLLDQQITNFEQVGNAENEEKLNVRIKALINSDDIVLFMKGDRNAPRCGFSSTMINIFTTHNLKYTTFDILEDYDVRQGIKKYSDWPTFPQVYVNGELMGGLDIIKESIENGDFDEMMARKGGDSVPQLKALINRSRIMLFMKGDRQNPRCGFSRTIIGLLEGADYDTFDILTDEKVRQDLKTYSDWPTYPQLYVEGELIGGLDIVKVL